MAITISGNGITTNEILDGTLTTTDISSSDVTSLKSGRKNLIINGAMNVAQRGTSFTGITLSDYRMDRFRCAISNLGTWTLTQDSDAPEGFANSLKYDCTTADASPDASNNCFIQHKIEGQNVQHLKKGLANAESVTLQFSVKSNKTGDIQVTIRDRDNTRQIGSVVTINAADTWETKTITFVGDTTGTLNDDANSSFEIEWWLDAGSNYTSGAVPTSWEAVSDADRAAGTTLALGDSTSNYFNITGVQLELGDTATDFEHRSFGEELALCQRYYEQNDEMGWTNALTSNYNGAYFSFNTTKRGNPTMTIRSSNTDTAGKVYYQDTASDVNSRIYKNSKTGCYIGVSNVSSAVGSNMLFKMEVDSEL